jgi:thiopeptide-type bacteriocin biosynthesis protein
MKDRSERITHAGFFVLRTPLLPFDVFASWGRGLEAPSATADGALTDAIGADRQRLRAYLGRILDSPKVRDAIHIASPSLAASLRVWRESPECSRGRRVERSLVKYVARMSGRSTPFGLCAGVATGRVGKETALRIAARSEYRRSTRLDFQYLARLAFQLARQPELAADAPVRPNSSLHRIGNDLRFFALDVDGDRRTRHFVVAESSPYVDRALAWAANGTVTPRQLAQALAQDAGDITREEAVELVGQMVDAQLLVTELAPALTGRGALDDLLPQLEGHPTVRDRLSQVRATLAALDGERLGAELTEPYEKIAATLADLPAPVEPSQLFQVDLFKPVVEASLGEQVSRELIRAVHLLRRLQAQEDPLREFRELFRLRYEENPEEVPLQDLFDPELGLFSKSGAGSPGGTLLHGLDVSEAPPRSPISWTQADAHRLRLLAGALAAGTRAIELADDDVERLAAPSLLPLPAAFAVQAVVAAPSEEALSDDRFELYVIGAEGPSGGNLLGRFCHGDPGLEQGVGRLLAAEEAHHPDAIFAEVVHLPSEEREGNFLQRPVLRQYEIPYLGRSTAPADHQIPVSDLTVTLSGERIVLRSRSLGREIIPRLATAHHFAVQRPDEIYPFLCHLQRQGVAGKLGWSWGALASAPFLPRVVHGKLVLSLATWNLAKEELAAIAGAADAALFHAVQELRARRQLPRFVLFAASAPTDHWLPVDLDNILSVEAWADLLRPLETAILSEMFSAPEALVAEGPEGRFVHELVVPFTVARPAAPAAHEFRQSAEAVRTFSLGSEWLYAKVYLSSSAADGLLADLGLAFQRLTQEGAMNRFFFVRYRDPFWHLRIRVHGDPRRLREEVLPVLSATASRLTKDGVAWRFQLDTYRREIERYGGDAGIELCEQIFCADSQAVVDILQGLSEDEPADLRWQLALRGMDRLLADLGLDLEERRATLETRVAALRLECQRTPNLERWLGTTYRMFGRTLTGLLIATDMTDAATGFQLALQARSKTMRPICEELRAHERRGSLSRPITEIAGSLLHMHVNRLLRDPQQLEELVLSDLLLRHLRSLAHRGETGTPV